jgi:hypothetical protein
MFPPFGFSIQELFFICYFYCQKKTAFVCEFQHTPVEIDDFLKVPHLVWT